MKRRTDTTSDPLIGRTIQGRYKLVERIGSGRLGPVYRALQWPLRRSVAIKLLPVTSDTESRHIRRFINEARILSRLRHPHTVRLIDFGRTDDKMLFLVTEYIAGGSLRSYLSGRRLAAVPALRLTRQIARALTEVHANGVIHRDLKPDNILVDEVEGDDTILRLIDFGLAKQTFEDDSGDIDITHPRARLGTPGYMSPEQTFWRPVDPASDLYALGTVLFEMITGHKVFVSDSPQELYMEHLYSAPPSIEDVAPDLEIEWPVEALILDLLAKKPEQRPESAQAVVQRIDSILAQLDPPEVMTSPTAPRPERLERFEIEDEPVSFAVPYAPIVTGAIFGGIVVAALTMLISL